MGNKTSNPYQSNNLRFYLNQDHPILGKTSVYSLKGQGTYVMKIDSSTNPNQNHQTKNQREQSKSHKRQKSEKIVSRDRKARNNGNNLVKHQLYTKIAEKQSEHLITFYTHEKQELVESQTTSSIHNQTKKSYTNSKAQKQTVSQPSISICNVNLIINQFSPISSGRTPLRTSQYWQFLNYDISQLLMDKEKEKNKGLEESFLREMIESCVKASLIFQEFDIYQQFNEKNIQIDMGMHPKIYWKNIQPDNSHRSYHKFRAMRERLPDSQDFIRYSYYSPEELVCMRTLQFDTNIDYEKCVIYNIGMIALSGCTGKNTKSIYDYKKKEIDEKKKQKYLDSIDSKQYSIEFRETLQKMLEIFPKRRPGFLQLLRLLRINII